MASTEGIDAEIVKFGDERFQEGRDSRSSEVAGLNAQLSSTQAALQSLRDEYDAHMRTHNPTPNPTPTPTPTPTQSTIIGMSSPEEVWATRLEQVGRTGVTARRIFADVTTTGFTKKNLIDYCAANKMMPVYSFKLPSNDLTAALTGKYDAGVRALAQYLASTGNPASVTFWHEPHGDDPLTPDIFVKLNERFGPMLKSDRVAFGPFLNGWLLDKQVATFKSYTSSALLTKIWDWVGIDTYEAGTIEAPGAIKPADRIPKLIQFVKDNGVPTKPLAVGEYNGYSAKSIADCGKAILENKQFWFGCMWNSTTGKGYTLEGDRLAAFKATLSDPRVRK